MIGVIARKEMLEMVRDGRFRIATVVILVLLLAALGTGWQRHAEIIEAHRAAIERERALWESQGEKNPHSAAHYGVYAFKPTGPLTFIDHGTESYTGVTVWLEAHKQNDFLYRPARDANTLQRFGELTAAAVLQLLLPLFIILMAFSAFAGERETGTLRQLLSLGVARRDLLIGKAAGAAVGLGLLLAPAAATGSLALTLAGPAEGGSGIAGRALLLTLSYLAYLALFTFITLGMSARASSARFALVSLLGFWVFSCLVVPRAVTDIAKARYPTPSAQEFHLAMASDTDAGIGGVTYKEFQEIREQELLAQYGVSNVNDLPINYSGWRLQVSEEYGNYFFDRHYHRLWNQFEHQDRLRQYAGLAAPLLAVRSVSMALAGTDFAHFRHFAAAAENYRRDFVRFLNDDLRDQAGPNNYSYAAGKDLWSQTPVFEYQSPSLSWAVEKQWIALLVLAVSLALAALFAWNSVFRLKVI